MPLLHLNHEGASDETNESLAPKANALNYDAHKTYSHNTRMLAKRLQIPQSNKFSIASKLVSITSISWFGPPFGLALRCLSPNQCSGSYASRTLEQVLDKACCWWDPTMLWSLQLQHPRKPDLEQWRSNGNLRTTIRVRNSSATLNRAQLMERYWF